MASKQQHKLFLALADRSVQLGKEEDDLWFKLRPWYENPYYPKPWNIMKPIKDPELEEELRKVKAKDRRAIDELLKLYDEMYPKEEYPEMHSNHQQSLLDKPEVQVLDPLPSPPPPMLDPDKIPLEGEDLVRAAEEVFGVKATEMSPEDKRHAKEAEGKNALAKKPIPEGVTDKGRSILEKFNSL